MASHGNGKGRRSSKGERTSLGPSESPAEAAAADGSSAVFSSDPTAFIGDLNNAAQDHMADKLDELEKVLNELASHSPDANREVHFRVV